MNKKDKVGKVTASAGANIMGRKVGGALVVNEQREHDAARRSHKRRRRSGDGISGGAQSPTGSTLAPNSNMPADAEIGRAHV